MTSRMVGDLHDPASPVYTFHPHLLSAKFMLGDVS